MTLKEKYPNVFKSLELWSAEWKPQLRERFEQNKLVSFEYAAVMTKLCLSTREEVEKWLYEE